MATPKKRVTEVGSDAESLDRSTWWREPTLWLLLIVASVAYFSRLTDRPMRGEETRRGLVAAEMMQSGDWIVPREQGELFLSRPPMQNWIIAGFASFRGKVDCWSVRAPSVIALLMTMLLIYGYVRQFFSQLAATAASIAYGTTGQVVEMGPLGETESMYALMVGGSLLLWHWGWTANWNAAVTWSLGYAFAAVGMLAKGPQAPVYFIVPVCTFLICSSQWRLILTRSHAIGIFVFMAIWNAWNIPFWMQVGTESMIQMYRNDIALRFNDDHWAPLVSHLFCYPFETLICLLPWSLLLPALLLPSFWRFDARTNPLVRFHLIAIGTTFLSVWFAVGAKTRYFMPLYPCFSVLFAVVIERCFAAENYRRSQRSRGAILAADRSRRLIWVGSWRRFQLGFLVAMLCGAFALTIVILTDQSSRIASDRVRLATVLCVTVVLIVGTARAYWFRNVEETESDCVRQRTEMSGLFAMGAFVWLAYFGVAMDPIVEDAFDVRPDVAKVGFEIPDGQTLASTGHISHWFTFHFGRTIPIIGMDPDQWPPDTNYVCYYSNTEFPESERSRFEIVGSVVVQSNGPSPRSIIVTRRLEDRIADKNVDERRTYE
ncbi:Undecaprenyl phosphate-alpha-4-amino-4-deoxy-L-arabinose arabinosyl transferase [Rubripirellula tenax]|uniref:Undecaprenyl phosphate-alpha-4-amino-4-deoxy-L-arabinose arabinosyl transferase n=1 Tax=Rubripirellula tenax TaxID=2528015 RepID=A0A5C6FJQ6_9BACT|nr:glycosyltransferase family 39 protein [Rubripirellula tenax]TWU60337.1 Undecaprenyl phosphate-alpha-4-amino-4-deoxy-L-arabinose arabinosyl transferase [Rubripirellula tenax]